MADLNLAIRISAALGDTIQELNRLERELGDVAGAGKAAGAGVGKAGAAAGAAGKKADGAGGYFGRAGGRMRLFDFAVASALGNLGAMGGPAGRGGR